MLTKAELLEYIREAKGVLKHIPGTHHRWKWVFAVGLTSLPSMLAKIAAEESYQWTQPVDPEEHLDKLLVDSRKWIGGYLERRNAFLEAVDHYVGIDLLDSGYPFPPLPHIDSLSKLAKAIEKHRCGQHPG